MKAKVLRLVHPCKSEDVVRALEDRLVEARAGHLIGIAYVVMYKAHDYGVDVAGETKRSPTLTRGMLHLLDEELSRIISGK